MRTILSDWLRLSVALVAAVALTSVVAAEEEKKSDTSTKVEATAVDAEASAMSARDKLIEKRRLNAVSTTRTPVEGFKPVEMFDAISKGEIEVSLRARDATKANIIFKNNSDKPLAIEMPEVFAAVPVLRQGLGGGGFGGGGGGQGGGGQGGGQGGGNQGIGGGGGQGGGQGGGGQGGGGGGGVFNIPPGRTGRLAIKTVCLEEGKPDPRSSIKYKLIPLQELSTDPRIAEMLRMLSYGEISQPVAQAAAWHVQDGLSWRELLVKNKLERMDGYYERYFQPQHLHFAQRVVTASQERAEAREKWIAEQKKNASERKGEYYGDAK